MFGGDNSYFCRQEIDSQTGQKVDRRVTSFPILGDFMGGYWRGSGTVTSQLNQPEKVTVDKLSIIPEIPGVANEGLTAKKT